MEHSVLFLAFLHDMFRLVLLIRHNSLAIPSTRRTRIDICSVLRNTAPVIHYTSLVTLAALFSLLQTRPDSVQSSISTFQFPSQLHLELSPASQCTVNALVPVLLHFVQDLPLLSSIAPSSHETTVQELNIHHATAPIDALQLDMPHPESSSTYLQVFEL